MSQSWSEVATELVDDAVAAGAVVEAGLRDDGAILYATVEPGPGWVLDASTSSAISIPVAPA